MSAREFDPATVVIDSLKFNALESIPDYDGRYGSYLREFLTDTFARLSPEEEACGRSYQRETIRNGGLAVLSPFSGEPAVSRQSFVVQGTIFYQFRELTEYYVAAGKIKFGYPLLALFVPDTHALLKWEIEKDRRSIERAHLTKLAAILAVQAQQCPPATPQTPPPVRITPTILLGHKNFAHHLWNELPALERLLADSPPGPPPPRLIVKREPLGAIDAIFPEIAHWNILRREDSLPTAESRGLFVHLGSYRISTSVRRRVIHHANANATPTIGTLIEQIGRSRTPVFWLSVRMQNPTLVNQVEVLTTIAARLLNEFRDCHILFDGFSPPADWQSCSRDDLEYYKSAADDSRRAIDDIIDNLARECGTPDPLPVVNAGGLGILDSIALAQLASAYFCHVGTVHHKIGWTANTPGVIHSNRNIVSKKAPIWYAPSRIEGGVMPDPIDPDTVTAAEREENYLILDVERVATTVVGNFRRYLSPGLC